MTELYLYCINHPNRAGTEPFFAGAHNSQFTNIMKRVGTTLGYPPNRIHTTSLRCGCASATTVSLLDMSQQKVTAIAQNHQHWLTPRGNQPYHYDMLMNGVVKTCQLYDYRANNIAEVLARFVSRFEKIP